MFRILITGGTIDKDYDPIQGTLTFTSSNIRSLLHQSRISLDINFETLMLKDSLFMREADRQAILDKCLHVPEDKILITHGTDTMVETAKILGEKVRDKTIVLTGAMVPASIAGSDALFNLGCALAALQHLPKGIFIVMNGKAFAWDNVAKNKQTGEFAELNQPL
ncbi:asparaginase [Candidatus Woesearchaeota archaeon]|nr:asparaginase [Candidatus Woesearchaeota archaeon]